MGEKPTIILLVLIHSFINIYKWNTCYILSTMLSTKRYKLVNTTQSLAVLELTLHWRGDRQYSNKHTHGGDSSSPTFFHFFCLLSTILMNVHFNNTHFKWPDFSHSLRQITYIKRSLFIWFVSNSNTQKKKTESSLCII